MQVKPKQNLIIACKRCKKEFHPITPNQKYCCPSCNRAAFNLRRRSSESEEYTCCLYCGTKIKKINNQKYCSKQCYRLYRNFKRTKKNKEVELKHCLNCDNIIKFDPNNPSNYKTAKYCSHKCATEYYWKTDDHKCSFKKDGFKVLINKTEFNTYNWTAYKNEKVILESKYYFSDLDSAYKDARKAFVS